MQDTPTDDMETTRHLLRAWWRNQSQEAFRELVRRYTDLVYSTAKRRLGGMEHGAADVTQMVFTRLARKAAGLPPDIILGAWLHRQAVRQALNFLRGERRRHAREQHSADMNAATGDESWQALMPHLDEAIASLPVKERSILILRYFHDERINGIAAELGISKEAAQKRLERATARLRERLERRMAVVPALSAGLLAGRSVQAAPPGLASQVAAGSLTEFGKAGLLSRWWDRATCSPLAASAGLVAGTVLGIPVGQALQSAFQPSPPLAAVNAGKLPAAPAIANNQASQQEAALSVLVRLGNAPPNHRVTIEFEALMARLPSGELPDLAAQAVGALSSRGRTRMMKRLLTHWASRDPQAVMEYLMTTGYPDWATNRGWDTFNVWLDKDAAAASRWLAERSKMDLRFGEEHDSFLSLASQTAKQITRHDPQKGVAWLQTLPATRRSFLLEALADDSSMERWRNDWPAGKWEELASATAVAVDAGNLEPQALRRILQRWKAEGPAAAETWALSLPAGTPASLMAKISEAKSQWLGDFTPKLEPQERYTARLESALNSRGELSLPETLAIIASNWTRKLPELTDWLTAHQSDGSADEALSLAARRMAWEWPWDPWLGQGNQPGGQPAQLEALKAAEGISQPEVRENLLRGLFRRWHATDPTGAGAWLLQSGWPVERIAILKSRLNLP
jgi:RNA polymerase sigma factor (sigma-70 family)